MQKLIATILIFCVGFLNAPSVGESLTTSYFSFDQVLPSLQIPKNLGSVEEIYRGRNHQTVILIQDAHSIPDAQKSIYHILGYLEDRYRVDQVGVEGAFSKLDPTLYQNFPDREILKEVFQKYLDRGELSGAAAACALNKNKAEYFGLENPVLYENEMRAFFEAEAVQGKIVGEIKSLKNRIETLKKKYYSPSLFQMDQNVKKFEAGKTNAADYFGFLLHLAETSKENEIRTKFPHLADIFANFRRKHSAFQADYVREIILSTARLKPALKGRAEIREFYFKEQAYKTDQISPAAFAAYLSELARFKKISVSFSPALKKEIQTEEKLKTLPGGILYQEAGAFLKHQWQIRIQNAAERQIFMMYQKLYLYEKLARLELSRDEWQELQQPLAAPPKESGGDLRKFHAVFGKLAADPRFESAHHFYRYAVVREKVFIERLLQRIGKDKPMVSLAGGFHTEGMRRALKRRKISFVLISPHMETVPEDSRYSDLMRGRVSWRRYIHPANGRADLFSAFSQANAERLTARLHQKYSKSETLRLIRLWRHEIFRDLAARGKEKETRKYISFIDQAFLKKIPQEEKQAFIHSWQELINHFVSGLRKLQAENQLTAQNIVQLSRNAAQFPFAVGGLAPEPYPVSPRRSETRAIGKTLMWQDMSVFNLNSADLNSLRIVASFPEEYPKFFERYLLPPAEELSPIVKRHYLLRSGDPDRGIKGIELHLILREGKQSINVRLERKLELLKDPFYTYEIYQASDNAARMYLGTVNIDSNLFTKGKSLKRVSENLIRAVRERIISIVQNARYDRQLEVLMKESMVTQGKLYRHPEESKNMGFVSAVFPSDSRNIVLSHDLYAYWGSGSHWQAASLKEVRTEKGTSFESPYFPIHQLGADRLEYTVVAVPKGTVVLDRPLSEWEQKAIWWGSNDSFADGANPFVFTYLDAEHADALEITFSREIRIGSQGFESPIFQSLLMNLIYGFSKNGIRLSVEKDGQTLGIPAAEHPNSLVYREALTKFFADLMGSNTRQTLTFKATSSRWEEKALEQVLKWWEQAMRYSFIKESADQYIDYFLESRMRFLSLLPRFNQTGQWSEYDFEIRVQPRNRSPFPRVLEIVRKRLSGIPFTLLTEQNHSLHVVSEHHFPNGQNGHNGVLLFRIVAPVEEGSLESLIGIRRSEEGNGHHREIVNGNGKIPRSETRIDLNGLLRHAVLLPGNELIEEAVHGLGTKTGVSPYVANQIEGLTTLEMEIFLDALERFSGENAGFVGRVLESHDVGTPEYQMALQFAMEHRTHIFKDNLREHMKNDANTFHLRAVMPYAEGSESLLIEVLDEIERVRVEKGNQRVSAKIILIASHQKRENLQKHPRLQKLIASDNLVIIPQQNSKKTIVNFLNANPNALFYAPWDDFVHELDEYRSRLIRLDSDGLLWERAFPVWSGISFEVAKVDKITDELLRSIADHPENSAGFNSQQKWLFIRSEVRELFLGALASRRVSSAA
ncbi:MAG: hypothetical protein HYZ83_00925 [Candidatus Omnitrophica bacterium]|nr:hypothetical protein [Candidatus Omnitrophota bacterium]